MKNKLDVMKGQATHKTVGTVFWILFALVATAVLYAIVYILYYKLLPITIS